MSYEIRVNSLADGDYAEVGVYKGHGAERIAGWMNPDGRLWLFDSFQGHGEPGEFDDAVNHPRGRYSDNSIVEVQARCPKGNIIVGFVPASLYFVAAIPFRFVRIDVDHYAPTKAACEFFMPRMVKGGVIEFDDYGVTTCEGATKAIDEVFGKQDVLPAPPFPHWVAP